MTWVYVVIAAVALLILHLRFGYSFLLVLARKKHDLLQSQGVDAKVIHSFLAPSVCVGVNPAFLTPIVIAHGDSIERVEYWRNGAVLDNALSEPPYD